MSVHRDVSVRCDALSPRCRVTPQIASPQSTAREARRVARELDGFHYRQGSDICAMCWEDLRALVLSPDERRM
jgi:hypothetical protein